MGEGFDGTRIIHLGKKFLFFVCLFFVLMCLTVVLMQVPSQEMQLHTALSWKCCLKPAIHVLAGGWKHGPSSCPPLCSNCKILMMFIWCTNSWLGHLGSSRIFGQGVFVFKWRRTMWGKVRVCSVFWGLFNLVTQYHTICKIAFNMPGINNKYT